jgi:hypothetical protein
MIVAKTNGELKEMGEPRKETQFWLFFKNGKLKKWENQEKKLNFGYFLKMENYQNIV